MGKPRRQQRKRWPGSQRHRKGTLPCPVCGCPIKFINGRATQHQNVAGGHCVQSGKGFDPDLTGRGDE